MSFGSYSRNGAAGIIGILMNAITMYAMAASIASVVIFLTVSFMIEFLSSEIFSNKGIFYAKRIASASHSVNAIC